MGGKAGPAKDVGHVVTTWRESGEARVSEPNGGEVK